MIVILKLFCYTNRRSKLLLHRRALGYYHQNFSLTGYHGMTQAIYTFNSILSSSISAPALPGPLYLSPFWDPLPFRDHYIEMSPKPTKCPLKLPRGTNLEESTGKISKGDKQEKMYPKVPGPPPRWVARHFPLLLSPVP